MAEESKSEEAEEQAEQPEHEVVQMQATCVDDLRAQAVSMNRSCAKRLEAGEVNMEQAGACTMTAESVAMHESAAGCVTAETVSLTGECNRAFLVRADKVEGDVCCGLMFVKEVEGDVTCLLSPTAAAIIGGGLLGLGIGLIVWRGRRG